MLQGCGCLSGVKNYLQHCVAGVQLFKRYRNLSAMTVLQGGSCLSSVTTYLSALCFRAAGCSSGVRTYLPGTVLQVCSCLRGVATYLPAMFNRGAAVLEVLEPFCQHCAAEVQAV